MAGDSFDAGKDALSARPLQRITRHVQQNPGTAVAVAVLLALGATFYSIACLQFKTNRGDLLSPRSSYNRRWVAFSEEFHTDDDLVVVVEGANTASVTSALEDVAAEIRRRHQWFANLLYKVELGGLLRKGCFYLSLEQLQGIQAQIAQLGPIIRGNWALLNLRNLYQGFRLQLDDADSPEAPRAQKRLLGELHRFASSFASYLADPSDYRSPWPVLVPGPAIDPEPRYLLANNGRMGFLQVWPMRFRDSFLGAKESVAVMREILAEVGPRHPEVEIGLTGLPVLEHDEMTASRRSMFHASILSFFGVSLLFVVGFRSFRHPLLAVVALLVGMAWSFGFLTLSVGHLNILSVAFSVILIGLGIDFGIHYLSRYMHERRTGAELREALAKTTGGVGPAIVTAAVTTALAFFAATLTEFLGVAELGIIAGGGILLCAVSALVVLPALIMLNDRRRRSVPGLASIGMGQHAGIPLRRPLRWIAVFLVLALLLGAMGTRVQYDHNLLNLQALGLESVRWEHKIINESNRSVWHAISVADSPEQVRERKKQFEALPTVSWVNEIATLIPDNQLEKQPLIESLHQQLAALPEKAPTSAPVDPDDLGRQIELLRQTVSGLEGAIATKVGNELARASSALAALPSSRQHVRVAGYQRALAEDLLARLQQLQAVASPEPITREDMPSNLVQRFTSPGGKWLLQVYARENVWDFEPLGQFVAEVRSVDPEATGHPLQAYEASRQMKASYEQAALYALIAIVAVLMVDFRRIDDTLLALLPLAAGMALLFGLLGLLGIDLNPANMIVLPLILGIGVDNGVHILHDFRSQKHTYRLSLSTARAIVLTSLTTMIGFGTLMISDHRGIRSLGVVLTIGVGCCLATSVLLLPAVLSWIAYADRPAAGRAEKGPGRPTGERKDTVTFPAPRHGARTPGTAASSRTNHDHP